MSAALAGPFGQIGLIFQSLTGLPLYIVAILFIALWAFIRGRRIMVEPRHNIDLAFGDGGYDDLSEYVGASSGRADSEQDPSIQTLEDKERALEQGMMQAEQGDGEEKSTEEESGADRSEIKTPDDGRRKHQKTEKPEPSRQVRLREKEDPFEAYRRFPYHDAPLWLMAWTLILIVTLLLEAVDGVWGLNTNQAFPLEHVLLKWLPDNFIPLSRPTMAMLFYTVIGYIGLEIGIVVLKAVLGIRQLHLIHPQDRRRKFAQKVFELCGFREFRQLDYSFTKWLFPVVLVVCGLLVWGDILIFYRGASAWCGAVAIAHLFPVVLARVFDHVWLYPVRYRRRHPEIRDRIPLDLIPHHMANAGWIMASSNPAQDDRSGDSGEYIPLIWKIHEREEGRQIPFEQDTSKLLEEFLLALTGSREWYEHQHQAWQLVHDEHNVVLTLPNDSGRSVWVYLLAVHEVIEEAGAVLVVYPDEMSCQREHSRFCSALFQTSLCWNLNVQDATDPDFETIDWNREVPLILFSDIDSIENVFLKHWTRYKGFFSNLSLIAFEDIDIYSGARASNLYFLLRRLQELRNELSQRPLRYIATSFPVATSIERCLAILLKETITCVDADNAPTANVSTCIVRLPSGFSSIARRSDPGNTVPEIVELVAHLRSVGYDPIYMRPTSVSLSDQSREQAIGEVEALARLQNPKPLSKAEMSISYLDNRNAYRLINRVRHAGIRQEEEKHLSFWVAKPDPMVALLVRLMETCRQADKPVWESQQRLLRSGVFAFSTDNENLKRRHCLAALREIPRTLSDLVDIFGEPFAKKMIRELLNEHRVDVVPPSTAEGEKRFRLREGVLPIRMRSEVVGEDAVSVEDAGKTQDRILLQVDQVLAPTTLYPGKVFMSGGQRYRIPLTPITGTTARRVLVCIEAKDVFTVKIRRCRVKWTGEGQSIRSRIGPTPFELSIGPVELEEEVLGYREWTNDTHQCMATYIYKDLRRPNQIGQLQTYMVEVRFPGDTLSEPAYHGLVHLFRAVINFRFGNDLNCPDVIVPEAQEEEQKERIEPVLRIVDTYPGGVGYVDHLDPDVFMEMVRTMRLLIEEVGRRQPALLINIPNCYRMHFGIGPVAEPDEWSSSVGALFDGEEIVRSPRATLFDQGRGAPHGEDEEEKSWDHEKKSREADDIESRQDDFLQNVLEEIHEFLGRIVPDKEFSLDLEKVDMRKETEEDRREGIDNEADEDLLEVYKKALDDTNVILNTR